MPVTSDQDVLDVKPNLKYCNNGHDYIIAMKPIALYEVNAYKNNLIETLLVSQKYLTESY